MLSISSLSVQIQDRTVIQGLSLVLQPGTVHAIMGPNGSGKSSLAATIMGYPEYQVTQGSMMLEGANILELNLHQRAAQGIFLGVQNPVEIQGLVVLHYLKELMSLHAGKQLSVNDCLEIVRPLLQLVGLCESILQRSVNVGFSGGEKKRFELLQMLLLKPRIAILDEPDSGVDIDGMKAIAHTISWYRQHNPDVIIILITHYRHITQYVQPDFVHVMVDGRIVVMGDSNIIETIAQHGYGLYEKRS